MGMETTFSGIGQQEGYFENIKHCYAHQFFSFLKWNLVEFGICFLAINPSKIGNRQKDVCLR